VELEGSVLKGRNVCYGKGRERPKDFEPGIHVKVIDGKASKIRRWGKSNGFCRVLEKA